MTEDLEFKTALAQTEAGVRAIGGGDPTRYQACWSADEDSTLFGAWGTLERGRADIAATLDWVGSRFSEGTLVSAYEAVYVGEDVAYTVGFERGIVRVDGAQPQQMMIRVTHIYRRGPEGWKLSHRHADHPPVLEVQPRVRTTTTG